MKALNFIFLTLVTCCYIHWIGVDCTRSPSIKCQLVDIIEQLDPKDQHMAPRFYRKKTCSGGLHLPAGYQCQEKSKEKKYLKLYDTRKSTNVEKQYESATQCHEVCVCERKGCKNPKTGICGKGMRWDKDKCHCVCVTQSTGSVTGGKAEHVPIKFFIISIALVFTICFLATAILITICYLRYKRKKDKYSLLYRVEWNEEQEEKLEEYMDYVDGPGSFERFKKRWWQVCCIKRGCKGETGKLLSNDNGDLVDNASIQARSEDQSAYDCFNIGYIAFKRDKFDMMLKWMQEAERKCSQENEDCTEILDAGELYEYLALAHFTAKDGDIENAKKYKQLALTLRRRVAHEQLNGNGDARNDLEANTRC
eukprot:Seg159.7 transcript_id=Seg159.7/GoldUCD/mRNA.D3Y31 product="hypothetical protein" protein_id=Seg159.7/GoldUCD/D3Y31